MWNVKTKKEQGKWSQEQEQRLICCQCYWPLWFPVQLGCCGERLCEDCISITKNPDFKCPHCHTACPNVTQDKGFRREIESLVVICPEYCDWKGLFKNLREHLKSHRTLGCKNCDQKFVSSDQLEAHQRDRCRVQVAPCPLSSVGCSIEVLRSEIGKHCLEVAHQLCLILAVKEILNKRSQSTTRKVISEEHQRMFSECHRRIESELQLIDFTEKEYIELNLKRETMDAKSMELREKLKVFSEDLPKTVERIKSLYQALSDMEKQIDEIKSKSVTGPNLMDDNDIYLWTVNLIILLSDNSSPIYSHPFQTSQWGYKLGTSMAIQTDEKTKRDFILVSFIIFRGDYDSILQWPFPYPVRLCLVDLKGTQKNIIHSIRPDSQTAIFGRPLNNANAPYQIPEFCPVEKLVENGNNYVSDDHMFVRIHVDFTETDTHPF
jgi:hypothetical protein